MEGEWWAGPNLEDRSISNKIINLLSRFDKALGFIYIFVPPQTLSIVLDE